MRLERTRAYEKRNLRHAAEFDLYMTEKESVYYRDVIRLIAMRCDVDIDVFESSGEMHLSIICDLNELNRFKSAYKVAKRHVMLQKKVGRGLMLVD